MLLARLIERWLPPRLVFAWMARRYDPSVLPGFDGTVVYELVSDSGSSFWTIDVFGSRAVASPGSPAALSSPAATGVGVGPPVAATVRIGVEDFARVGVGLIDPAEPLLAGRASFTGDLGLAARLPEMFRAPQPR